MFHRYYLDELTYLRELGREFAAAHPDAAHFLADRNSDPDVERLLEGFAFLSARLRQKIDDELPELTHSTLQILWPHYLRPMPSITLMQFQPARGTAKERRKISRGIDIDSVPVEGTPCRFRLAQDAFIDPVEVVGAGLENPGAGQYALRLSLKAAPGLRVSQLGLPSLRFFLNGEPDLVGSLYLLLARYVTDVEVRSVAGGRVIATAPLPDGSLRMCGYDEDEALLPWPANAWPGFRLLQEYFTFPQKFYFFEVGNLARLAEVGGEDQFDIVFRLDRPPVANLRLAAENFLLGCAPAINLFEADANPISVEHDKTEYLVRASGNDPAHYEIFSVDRAWGFTPGTAQTREYTSFLDFAQTADATGSGRLYYSVRLKPAVVGDGTDSWLSFFSAPGDPALPDTETVSVSLTCTNRRLARSLRVGDVSVATSTSPEFARFRNISNVTPSLPPPLGGDLHWRLISHLALSQQGLTSVDALRTVLALYNFQAIHDRQAARENELRLAGIRTLTARPADALIGGAAARGRHTILEMDDANYANTGDLVLFCAVLDEFLAQYASLNTFSRLTVKTTGSGEEYAWKPRFGRRTIL